MDRSTAPAARSLSCGGRFDRATGPGRSGFGYPVAGATLGDPEVMGRDGFWPGLVCAAFLARLRNSGGWGRGIWTTTRGER
jgi:hypothetical protein